MLHTVLNKMILCEGEVVSVAVCDGSVSELWKFYSTTLGANSVYIRLFCANKTKIFILEDLTILHVYSMIRWDLS